MEKESERDVTSGRLANNRSSVERWTRALSVLGFTLILSLFLLASWIPPARHYEISMYSVYPPEFWIMVILSFSIGQVILVANAVVGTGNRRWWVLGLIILLLTNTLLLSLPSIRGYSVYGNDDVLTHIGHTKDILRDGRVGELDFYPVEHILGSVISLIGGQDVKTISFIIPPLFSLLFVVFSFVLIRRIAASRSVMLLAMCISAIMLYGNTHLAYSPYPQSFMFLPLVLYVYLRSRHRSAPRSYVIALLLTIPALILFHPLITLLLVLAFIVHDLSTKYGDLEKKSSFQFRNLRKSRYAILIALTAFFSWQFYVYILVGSLEKTFSGLVGRTQLSEFQTYSTLARTAGTPLVDLVALVFSVLGQFIILGMMAFFSVMLIIKRRNQSSQEKLFYVIFCSMAFLFFAALSMVGLFATNVVGFGRIFAIAALFASLPIAHTITMYLRSSSTRSTVMKTAKVVILLVIVISLVLLSTFNLYMSPRTKYGAVDVMPSELNGMESFFSMRDDKILILELGISQDRFYDAIYGREVPRTNVFYLSTQPLDHFGYSNHSGFGNCYEGPRYFLLTQLGRDFYPNVYPEYPGEWRFTTEDFARLQEDVSVNHVLTNSGIDVYITTNQ